MPAWGCYSAEETRFGVDLVRAWICNGGQLIRDGAGACERTDLS